MIDQNTMAKLLTELSGKRPIFHNEFDLQYELAWSIRTLLPDTSKVRVELPYDGKWLDIHVSEENGSSTVIELKYKAKNTEVPLVINGEAFNFQPDNTTNAKYDFWLDVERLQGYAKANKQCAAYAIFLTNNCSYWGDSVSEPDFKIDRNRGKVSGTLDWRLSPAPKKRTAPIHIGNYEYDLTGDSWRQYSSINSDNKQQTEFDYLLLSVPTLN